MHDHSPAWYRLRGLVFGVIYIVGFIGGWALWSRLGKPHETSQLAIAAGAFLTFCCFALRAWGSAYLHADVVWNPDALSDELIVEGPFRFTRSPLYLGNTFMALGIGLLAAPPGYAFIVVATLWFVFMLVRYETAQLHARFGPLVDDYVAAVPALFPRLTPANVVGTARVKPSLAQGLRSEIFTASLTVATIVLAIFGRGAMPVFMTLWISGWIAQHIATWNRVPNASPPEP